MFWEEIDSINSIWGGRWKIKCFDDSDLDTLLHFEVKENQDTNGFILYGCIFNSNNLMFEISSNKYTEKFTEIESWAEGEIEHFMQCLEKFISKIRSLV